MSSYPRTESQQYSLVLKAAFSWNPEMFDTRFLNKNQYYKQW
jgi:hypothetical protein